MAIFKAKVKPKYEPIAIVDQKFPTGRIGNFAECVEILRLSKEITKRGYGHVQFTLATGDLNKPGEDADVSEG